MPTFRYKARDKFSRAVSGQISAQDSNDVAKKLSESGYVPVSIEAASVFSAQKIIERFNRVSLEEVNAFTRQLYALFKAGLPLLAILQAIAAQTKNKCLRNAISEIASDVRGGSKFSDALKKHDRIFDALYVSLIAAAEASGTMAEILARLNNLIDQEIDTRQRVKSATRYPLIAFFVLCMGFTIIVTFVIPRFAVVYSQFNAILPLPTRILITISVLVNKYWYIALLVIGGAIFGFTRFINTIKGRAFWDNFKLKIPIFGPLVTMLLMSRFSRITAMLMKSGVPILEVLDLSSRTSGNVIIARAIQNIRESVNQGKGVSEPMKLSGLFPPIVVQMVAAGEQTGNVDELLLSVADYYDLEAGYRIKNLSTYIEPILIFVLALMVLLMALAIFLPMWNLINLFKPG